MIGQVVRETGERYTTWGESKSSTGSVERKADDDDNVKNGDGCSSSSLEAPALSVARGLIRVGGAFMNSVGAYYDGIL